MASIYKKTMREALEQARNYSDTSEIEEGLSANLGFEIKINEKDADNTDKEKLSLTFCL